MELPSGHSMARVTRDNKAYHLYLQQLCRLESQNRRLLGEHKKQDAMKARQEAEAHLPTAVSNTSAGSSVQANATTPQAAFDDNGGINSLILPPRHFISATNSLRPRECEQQAAKEPPQILLASPVSKSQLPSPEELRLMRDKLQNPQTTSVQRAENEVNPVLKESDLQLHILRTQRSKRLAMARLDQHMAMNPEKRAQEDRGSDVSHLISSESAIATAEGLSLNFARLQRLFSIAQGQLQEQVKLGWGFPDPELVQPATNPGPVTEQQLRDNVFIENTKLEVLSLQLDEMQRIRKLSAEKQKSQQSSVSDQVPTTNNSQKSSEVQPDMSTAANQDALASGSAESEQMEQREEQREKRNIETVALLHKSTQLVNSGSSFARFDDLSQNNEGGSGPLETIIAKNFAPGTTVADIVSSLTPITGPLVNCRLLSERPTVVAEMVFSDQLSAAKAMSALVQQNLSLILPSKATIADNLLGGWQYFKGFLQTSVLHLSART
jgi:hypothetical protein